MAILDLQGMTRAEEAYQRDLSTVSVEDCGVTLSTLSVVSCD
jgi:hypothetical protein